MLGRAAATERSAQQRLLISSHPALLEARRTAERTHAPYYLHPLYKQLNRRTVFIRSSGLFLYHQEIILRKQTLPLSELKSRKVSGSSATYLITVAASHKKIWVIRSPGTRLPSWINGGVLKETELHYAHIKWPPGQWLMALHDWVRNSHVVRILIETSMWASTACSFLH